MRIKNISFIFTLVCFLLLFSLHGYCLFGSSKNIETYDNPDIDYGSNRYFTFYFDKLSMDYLQNKSFQSSIIELLEEKNYIYVEDIKDANFVVIIYSSNEYEKSLVNVPFYNPGTTINASGWISGTYVYGSAHASGNWGIRTAIKGRYYPFIGISCIGNLQNEPELIWQGNGIKSTRKSNLEKYGKELIEEMLAKFPEISEKIEEELPPIEIEENENIKMLLEQLKNN
jgi:hypothetical protein